MYHVTVPYFPDFYFPKWFNDLFRKKHLKEYQMVSDVPKAKRFADKHVKKVCWL